MFRFYRQLNQKDCGPTCLQMIANHYGKKISLQYIKDNMPLNNQGVSLLGMVKAAEAIGFDSIGVRISTESLINDVPLPCVVHWRQNHYVVVYKVSTFSIFKKMFMFLKNKSKANVKILVADPAVGLIKYNLNEFRDFWIDDSTHINKEGFALLLEPTEKLYQLNKETEKNDFLWFIKQIAKYSKLFYQLLIGTLLSCAFQLAFPILTRFIVDVGIKEKDFNFVYLILIGQSFLLMGRLLIEFIRDWVLLNISGRINFSILADFLHKLMKLPLPFFDVKQFGDIMQRISDHDRIEAFLTTQTVNIIFSSLSLITLSFLLLYYDVIVFFVFIIFSSGSVLWMIIFLNSRRKIDYDRFELSSASQNSIIQIVQGMQDIKLSNAENYMRSTWEQIQINLFKLQTNSLTLSQIQKSGAFALNEGKNILITFFVAKLVLEDSLTLGTMLSIQYIIGQLNGPIEQSLGFIQNFQDAQISLKRLNEVHDLSDEEDMHDNSDIMIENGSIILKDVSFKYPGSLQDLVLNKINIHIPVGKTTAIVGVSGSGKTTLLKLLLKFYEPTEGHIYYNEYKFNDIKPSNWRRHCGVVMQEGFIFSDTIFKNVVIGSNHIDQERFTYSIKMANINDFVDHLPLGANTKIGSEGLSLSQGQKQRILIARAIYKNPNYLFFDEATNALDATNEGVIMKNLYEFFDKRTVVIVAHRLSTVKDADQIIVLHNSKIVEVGSHKILISKKGYYWTLVKNQLELGE